MKKNLKKIVLILFCLYCMFFVIGSIMSPLLAHFGYYDQSAILTFTFTGSCHQQPDRSFWIAGYPMALCARCFGFYVGVAVWTLTLVLTKISTNFKIFTVILLIIFIDILLNFFLHINTGNITRFITGSMMGIIFSSIIDYLFKLGKVKEE